MYAAASTSSMAPKTSAGSPTGLSQGSLTGAPSDAPVLSTSNVLSGANTKAAAITDVGEKKEGVVRIGLATVKTGAVGEGLAAAELASAVQNSLREHLRVSNVEVVILEAKLTSAIDAEAKQKECDLVIHANVAHKKGGGGFGMFKAVAPMISSVVPMASAGHIAGSVASSAIITAASVSGSVKAKDELTLDVKLNKADGTNALTKQVKVKAKSNGDDIISAAVGQAAQAIVDTVGK